MDISMRGNSAAATAKRRWVTIEQLSSEFPAFSRAAIRALIQRSRPHYNSKGEWVDGNGLADAICQPGGKNGKITVDAIRFGAWLEFWVILARTAQPENHAT